MSKYFAIGMVFTAMLALALVGCQDDGTLTDPVVTQTGEAPGSSQAKAEPSPPYGVEFWDSIIDNAYFPPDDYIRDYVGSAGGVVLGIIDSYNNWPKDPGIFSVTIPAGVLTQTVRVTLRVGESISPSGRRYQVLKLHTLPAADLGNSVSVNFDYLPDGDITIDSQTGQAVYTVVRSEVFFEGSSIDYAKTVGGAMPLSAAPGMPRVLNTGVPCPAPSKEESVRFVAVTDGSGEEDPGPDPTDPE